MLSEPIVSAIKQLKVSGLFLTAWSQSICLASILTLQPPQCGAHSLNIVPCWGFLFWQTHFSKGWTLLSECQLLHEWFCTGRPGWQEEAEPSMSCVPLNVAKYISSDHQLHFAKCLWLKQSFSWRRQTHRSSSVRMLTNEECLKWGKNTFSLNLPHEKGLNFQI